VLEGRKGQPVKELEQLREVRRDIDVEYMKRANAFLKLSAEARKPLDRGAKSGLVVARKECP